MSYHGRGEARVVCVTGASGFIASWLVKLLLHKGYTVNASVRDPRDTKKTEHLVKLEGAKERLHLFKAELLEEGSFDSAIHGCVGVFHTASPVSFSASDPQAEIVDPAVKGTLNVLKSCAKSPSVKRMILTGSAASVFYTGKPVTQDSVADETWFSDPELCQRHQLWYMVGKTLAETAAWEFAKENWVDLVTMHPSSVFGPFLQPTLCFSVGIILNLINGDKYPADCCWSVDVRDVAEAHIRAFETPSASGRYLLVGNNVDYPQVLNIIHQLYPELPDKCGDPHPATLPRFKASSKKAEQELGINFMPLETTLKDTIECFKEKGFLHP